MLNWLMTTGPSKTLQIDNVAKGIGNIPDEKSTAIDRVARRIAKWSSQTDSQV